MTGHDLTITARPGAWRLFAARKVDKNFAAFAKRVLTRDQYTCQFCGFQAGQHQEVINLDGNYHNNTLANMVCACVLCTQCLFLEMVGQTDYGGGILIYLPDLSQAELNGLCHVLFCAIANATAYRQDAQTLYRSLKQQAKTIEEKLGEGMSDPALLGRLLLDSQLQNRQRISQALLREVRLLPTRSKFAKQIETWAQAALTEMREQEQTQ